MKKSWIIPRSGFLPRCERIFREPCTIGYLGDSVMAQRQGYRPLLHEWLCRYTGHDHRAVNACLGSNGSICSVFVMDELVIKHQPVLCFIQTSVADMAPYTPAHEVGPVMEGIIQKLNQIRCTACILHMFRDDNFAHIHAEAVSAQEVVADYYEIPSIHVGARIKEVVRSDASQLSTLFKDGIHTTENGARLCASLVTEALEEIFSKQDTEYVAAQSDAQHKKSPLYRRSFAHSTIMPVLASMTHHPEVVVQGHFRYFYPYIEINQSNPLTYTFTQGDIVGFLAVLGKESGEVRISSESKCETLQLWDEWCATDRIKACIFNQNFSGCTRLTIEVTNQQVDYGGVEWMHGEHANERKLRIVGFLLRHDPALSDLRSTVVVPELNVSYR